MRTSRVHLWLFSIAIVFAPSVASGQDFPTRPIRIVATEPGTSIDGMSRLMAPGLAAAFGQPVIVENRPAGVRMVETVSKATPDGYTLLIIGSSFWLAPFLQDHLPWDPIRDFSPVVWIGSSPNVLVVHPSLPVASVKELIAWAKARPGELNYGTPTIGSAAHLAGELFNAMAGVKIVTIPYKSSGQALSALLANQVQIMFSPSSPAVPHIKSGKLRALAVTSPQPSALAPGLPTVAAAGLPGYESASTYGMFVPVKTPPAVVNRLNQEIVRVLNKAEVKEKLFSSGVDVIGSSPEQLGATVKSEMNRLGKLIKDLGIRAEQ